MASAGLNHLTVEEVCQMFAIQAVLRIEYVVVVGEVGRSSSF